jgi:hypothetical protein
VVTALIALFMLNGLPKRSQIKLTVEQELPIFDSAPEITASRFMVKLATLTCLTMSPLSRRLRLFGAKVRQALTPSEDYWTWITLDGEVYEDVDVLFVQGDQITFRHKCGRASLPISVLSENDRAHLAQGYRGARPLSMLPEAEESRELASTDSKAA